MICVYMCLFKVVDSGDSIVGGGFCTHCCASSLKVMFPVKFKIVHGENHSE